MISVVIPLFNRWELTKQCLANLGPVPELILVDNGSTDETAYQFPDCDILIRNKTNRGFAKACNQAAGAASGNVLVFLNNDTIPQPGWLDNLTAPVTGDVAVAGCRLTNPAGEVIHAGVGIDFNQPPGREAWNETGDLPSRDVAAVTGACMAVNATDFHTVGGFDEGFWNGYEDVDFCLRMPGIYRRVIYTNKATVTHLESQSGPERWTAVAANVERLRGRWS